MGCQFKEYCMTATERVSLDTMLKLHGINLFRWLENSFVVFGIERKYSASVASLAPTIKVFSNKISLSSEEQYNTLLEHIQKEYAKMGESSMPRAAIFSRTVGDSTLTFWTFSPSLNSVSYELVPQYSGLDKYRGLLHGNDSIRIYERGVKDDHYLHISNLGQDVHDIMARWATNGSVPNKDNEGKFGGKVSGMYIESDSIKTVSINGTVCHSGCVKPTISAVSLIPTKIEIKLSESIKDITISERDFMFIAKSFLESRGASAEESVGEITSTGGASSYYDMKLSKRQILQLLATGKLSLDDYGLYNLDNDFDALTILKSLKRVLEDVKGRGKKGSNAEYNLEKIVYSVGQIKKRLTDIADEAATKTIPTKD